MHSERLGRRLRRNLFRMVLSASGQRLLLLLWALWAAEAAVTTVAEPDGGNVVADVDADGGVECLRSVRLLSPEERPAAEREEGPLGDDGDDGNSTGVYLAGLTPPS